MSIYSDIYKNVDYPVICTRGVIIFPNQDVIIDVGRPMSINALNKARSDYDSLVWIVTQKDIMVENPETTDMYSFGTLCSIKHVRQEKDVMKVKFHGIARAQANTLTKTEEMFVANISVVDDVSGDEKEELVLVRKLVEEFEQMSQNIANLPREMISQMSTGVSASVLADQFGQYLPMALPARQEILEAVNLNSRLLLLLQ
ncbi:MAG: LON peptidase substrate-binding domain-containing protein, partial [Erysipelotrichaceae bacterium]|nr:LON peptidase substrate-binding domain-containing protein [Erysipelotrichaceae bacterium]